MHALHSSACLAEAKEECDSMAEYEWLAEKFEENRGHLRAVAYRMLSSLDEADDAVQEARLRLSRSDERRACLARWSRHLPWC